MNFITKFMILQKVHFQKLNDEARKLITSIVLYNIGEPLFYVFINAFLWRKSHEIPLVLTYNLAFFCGLPIGFYINGILLRKVKTNTLYRLGALLIGVVITLLIFFPVINYFIVFIFGIILGICSGIYWGNRNLLNLRLVESERRLYFASLDSSSATITNIVIPVIVGFLLVAGNRINLYSTQSAYYVLGLSTIGILFFAGYVIRNVSVQFTPVSHILLPKSTSKWNKIRLFTVLIGLISGINLTFPSLLILRFLGQEDVLGTVQSISAIISAITIYYVSTKAQANHRVKMFTVAFILMLTAASLFGSLFSAIGVFCYVALQSLGIPFSDVPFTSISFDATDEEEKKTHFNHYSYIFDQELFLNIGRVGGLIGYFILLNLLSQNIALRFTPFIFTVSQGIMLLLVRKLEKKTT